MAELALKAEVYEKMNPVSDARGRDRTRVAEPIADTVAARILLAEDDPAMRAMVARALRREGYEVCEVQDGTELLERLADRMLRPFWDVDLIVSDVRMPGKTGLDVLTGLRKSDWSMPVILITAFGEQAIHTEAKRLGAAKVLDKPFDLDALTDAVKAIVPPVLPT